MTTVEMKGMIDLVNFEAERLREFLSVLDERGWSMDSACEGWKVEDVVGHLSAGAETWANSITRAVAGDANPPPGQAFLVSGDRGSDTISQAAISTCQQMGSKLLEGYSTGYSKLRHVLSSLGPEDWDKPCFHRRGQMPLQDFVSLRVQELAVHGWDIRSSQDKLADLWEESLPVLVAKVPRWLRTAFRPGLELPTPIRFRFDVSGPVPVHEEVLVTGDGFQVEKSLEGSGENQPDVTFKCNTGSYILLIYGRLDVKEGSETGRLVIEGAKDREAHFTAWFQGF